MFLCLGYFHRILFISCAKVSDVCVLIYCKLWFECLHLPYLTVGLFKLITAYHRRLGFMVTQKKSKTSHLINREVRIYSFICFLYIYIPERQNILIALDSLYFRIPQTIFIYSSK